MNLFVNVAAVKTRHVSELMFRNGTVILDLSTGGTTRIVLFLVYCLPEPLEESQPR